MKTTPSTRHRKPHRLAVQWLEGAWEPRISILSEDMFDVTAPIMIWSMGSDGRTDPNAGANPGASKDSVMNWNN